MACYVLTLTAVLFIHVVQPFGFRLGWLYDNYGEFLASMNVFAWAFCTMLLVKGHLAPSSTDSGHTGSYVKDFYWGYELYPRLPGNIDVKMFTNCRFGELFIQETQSKIISYPGMVLTMLVAMYFRNDDVGRCYSVLCR